MNSPIRLIALFDAPAHFSLKMQDKHVAILTIVSEKNHENLYEYFAEFVKCSLFEDLFNHVIFNIYNKLKFR